MQAIAIVESVRTIRLQQQFLLEREGGFLSSRLGIGKTGSRNTLSYTPSLCLSPTQGRENLKPHATV
jgi:hypothetical protein